MGGHHYPALEALLRSAARQGVPVTFISVKGLSPGARDAVAAAGVGVRWRPSAAQPLAWFLLVAGYALEWLSRLRTRTPGWGVAYQWEVASRCLLEAASLRIAPPGACCVILTASERLHGTTVALSGVPHVRVIHDMRTREGPVLSRLERRLERGRARVIAVCTTEAVRDELEELYPGIAAQVQTFTLADPDLYIAHGERGAARRAFGFGDDDFVAAIVGGWWRTKDMGTVERGLARAERPVGAIVAGHPIDPELLERMRQSCR